jgi:hypothetical protein
MRRPHFKLEIVPGGLAIRGKLGRHLVTSWKNTKIIKLERVPEPYSSPPSALGITVG